MQASRDAGEIPRCRARIEALHRQGMIRPEASGKLLLACSVLRSSFAILLTSRIYGFMVLAEA